MSIQDHKGITVATKDLSFSVKDKKSRIDKKILHNVNFVAYPGKLHVIMGPSGCGKTTFLNAISGRLQQKAGTTLEGQIFYNGNDDKKIVKQVSTYVMQADNLMEFLTVRETLFYASLLRLSDLSKKERQMRVDRITRELALDTCLDVLVGGSRKKGISGGQKKRVSIAIEMMEDPQLLFLDEPTSGLDSSLAYDTMKVLIDVAKTGRTVISTVHQPRSQTFALFDQLLLLTNGRVVYEGSASNTQEYFASIGYPCPPQFNPADFYLDLIAPSNAINKANNDDENVAEANAVVPDKSQSLIEAADAFFEAVNENVVLTGRVVVSNEEIEKFPTLFLESDIGKNVLVAVEREMKRVEDKLSDPSREGFQKLIHVPSIRFWFIAYSVLTRRSFINSWRNPIASVVQFVIQIGFGLIIGGIFFQLYRYSTDFLSSSADAVNIIGFLLFISVQYAFSNMDSLFAFTEERAMYNRDMSSDLYPPSAFFMAKMTADFPFQHTALVMFSVIAYFMGGLGMTVDQFFTFLLIGIVATFSAASYIYMVGTGISNVQAASIAAPIGSTIILLLSGFFLPDDAIPGWIAWLRYVAYLRYVYFAFLQNEFRPDVSIGAADGLITSNQILDEIAQIPRALTMWQNIGVCVSLGILYRLIAFMFLKYMHRSVGVEQ